MRVSLGIFVALVLAVVLRQGIVHRWRLSPAGPTWDCRTQEDYDDGCSMFGSCYKCAPTCLPGTDPRGIDHAGCGR